MLDAAANAALASGISGHRALRIVHVLWRDIAVCPAPDGSLWRPDRLSDLFASTMKRLDLPRIRFHDLRHTHATHVLREGRSP